MVKFEHDGDVATLSLDRPPVNALDDSMTDAFDRALDQVDSSSAKVILIRSTGGNVFSPGADIGFIERCITAGPDGARQMLNFVRHLQRVFTRLEASPKPSVVALDGATTGGGLELALACDLRVVGASVRIGLPESKIGLLPGAGGTQRLTRLAGRGTASRLILNAELISGVEAHALGIAQYVVANEDVLATSRALAENLASLPSNALANAKKCIALAVSEDGFEAELRFTEELLREPSTAARISQFLSTHKKGVRHE